MGNIFEMIKQAASMQKQMKQIQKELAGKLVEHEAAGGAIKVVACGDMTVKQIKIAPALLNPEQAEKTGRLITEAVNGALEKSKKEAGQQMAKIAGSGGGGGLMDLLK